MIEVYKIGGNVVDDRPALEAFCRDFAAVPGPKVLVHGGGVMAGRLQEALGIPVVKIEGRRVTDERTLEVVTMVYAGLCNKTIVALLQASGCNALGLSGADGSCVTARRPPIPVGGPTAPDRASVSNPSGAAPDRASVSNPSGGRLVDFGFVGDVTPESVNAEFLRTMLDAGLTPVLCAINHDGEGCLLITNADTVASSVASALGATLNIVFEKPGVLLDVNDPQSVIPLITPATFEALKASGQIADGMIPKIQNAIAALHAGCPEVRIGATRISLP